MVKRFTLALLLTVICLLFLGNVGTRSVTLTWTETTPAVTFNVYKGTLTGVCTGTPTPFASNISALTFTDFSVTAGQTYVYAVSAVKGVESTCSSEVQVSVPTAPATPQTLQGTTT
jgi:hypothetical protein